MIIGGIEVVVERKDIKNTHLAVYPPDAHVHVSAPRHLADADIVSFVQSKLSWIRDMRAEVLSQARQTKREYVSGESHYLFGTRYRLKVIERETPGHSISKSAGMIRMAVNSGSTRRFRETILWEWYREQLHKRLEDIVCKYATKYGEQNFSWQVKRMKNRWGSCVAAKRSIIFNSELARVPVECIEYIVVHELTHLKVGNHGSIFVKQMDMRMPNWRKQRKRLNDFVAVPELYGRHERCKEAA